MGGLGATQRLSKENNNLTRQTSQSIQDDEDRIKKLIVKTMQEENKEKSAILDLRLIKLLTKVTKEQLKLSDDRLLFKIDLVLKELDQGQG